MVRRVEDSPQAGVALKELAPGSAVLALSGALDVNTAAATRREISTQLAGKAFHSVMIDSYEAGMQNWTDEMIAEFRNRRGYDPTPWLPALTGRVSAVTPQGYEWVGGGAFSHRLEAYRDLQKCAARDASCLTVWSLVHDVGYDYLYVPKLAPRSAVAVDDEHECCAALRMSLRGDPAYETVFDGPGATIFRRRS